MRHVLSFIILNLFAAPTASAALPSVQGPATCNTVELHADVLDCEEQTCQLLGNASLTCDHITLQGDNITLELTSDFGFNGAIATGHVVLIDGKTLVTCQSIELEAGRIRGKIVEARVQLFEKDITTDAAGKLVPNGKAGRAVQTIGGDVERLSADEFRIDDGTYTLCDCGEDTNPSWQIRASEINVNIKERATLWWPRLELNIFGLGMLPLPLPTPVLSLPIKRRAAGLLAPSLTFLRFPYPLLDLPIFIPIGDSYDITITPGIRSDWGLHRSSDLSTWAAPRLGGRFRYAPVHGVQGSISAQWTRDTHFTSARLAHRNDSHSGLEDPELIELAQADPRWGLRDRVILEAQHAWTFSPQARWNLQGHWVSDDYVQRDFSVNLEDQVAQYLPSRTRIDWQTGHLLASGQLDYLQRLNNGGSTGSYSNTSGHELSETQRAPSLELWLRPVHLGHRIFASGGIVAERYGSWSDGLADSTTNRWMLYNRLTTSYFNQIGPLQFKAQVGSHFGALFAEQSDPQNEAAGDGIRLLPYSSVSIQTTLAKRFGKLVHVIQPFLALNYSIEGISDLMNAPENPWLELEPVQQLAVGLRQTLSGLGGAKRGRLDLEWIQPFSLASQTEHIMPTAINLHLRGLRVFQLAIRASIDWQMLDLGPADASVSAGFAPWSFLRFFAQYGRLSPGAEILSRSIYEISGLTDTGATGEWMHYLRSGIELKESKTWKVLYQADVLLPRLSDDSSDRPQLSNHLIRMGYHSPCECWGAEVVAQIANPDLSAGFGTSFLDNMTVRVNLTIGDYSLGSF